MLMLGREIKLPVDSFLPYIGCKDSENIPEYVFNLQSRLEKIHENARLMMQKTAVKQQHWYNSRLKENKFSPGSLVYYNCPKKMHQKRATKMERSIIMQLFKSSQMQFIELH